MPLRHEPDSLCKVAMATIAENFEMLCYGASPAQVSRMVDSEEYLNIPGPFVDLPPLLVEGLYEEMKHLGHLKKQHLHLLTTPRLTCCSLYGVADLPAAFEFLTHRCKNLRHLNLSYLRHIYPATLLKLIPCFSTLYSLNLRMTLTVDQVLAHIGLNCPVLKELNIADTPTTDRGLVQLCVATEGRRRCLQLARLIVTGTNISASGATVALQALPHLTEFEFDNIFEAIEKVEHWDRALEARLLTPAGVRLSEQPVDPPTILQLRSLCSGVEMVSVDALEAAARLCPYTTSVTISGSWLPSEALYKLMVLENLTALSLTNGEGMTFDFYEGVLPLLSACGDKLQNLILANFPSVDIAGIGRNCSNLRNLALSAVATYEKLNYITPEWFTELQALEIWTDPTSDLNEIILRQLLLSTNLRNLLFTSCTALTDELLEDIWKVNPMKCLSHLTLDHCHNISPNTLHQLLDSDNKLTVLRIWSCVHVTKSQNKELARRIASENMDLYFEWFAYLE